MSVEMEKHKGDQCDCPRCAEARELAQEMGPLINERDPFVILNALGMLMADVLTCFDGGACVHQAEGSERLELFQKIASGIINNSYAIDAEEQEEGETLQ